MSIWKIAAVLLVGAAFTEGGRKAMRNAAKELIKTSQSAKDKASLALHDLKVEAKALIEEAKTANKKDNDQGSKQA